MLNKVAVVTGANAGIGFQTTLSLVRMGARVVMACRSMDKATQAQGELLAEVPGADTVIIPLDLSEPESVREFARRFAAEIGRLDLLVNNAGIVGIPLARNSVGQELQLATNYLGGFALTGLLLPLFPASGWARIVNVGSLMNRFGKLDLDDLNWEKTPYDEWQGYGRSKVAMLSFTLELDRRLRKSGSNIVALSAHPGFASTNIHQNSAALQPKSAFDAWRKKKLEPLIPRADQAARPIAHAATADTVQGGEYYGPKGLFEIAGKKVGKARINPVARDTALGKRLWTLSESMTGVRYLSDL